MRLRLSSFRLLNLQTKVAIGFSLVSAIFIGLSWAGYYTVKEAEKAKSWVSHNYEVLLMLEAVSSSLKDVETGQRGYVVSGQEVFLEPYYTGIKAVPQDIKRLRQLTQDNLFQQQQIDRLESLALEKIAIARTRVETQRNQGFKPSKQINIFNDGNQTMRRVRWLIQQMKHTEIQLLSQRSQLVETSREVANHLILTGLGVELVILLGLFYIISRETSAHQRYAADYVKAEAELLESEARFRRLSEATFEAVAITKEGKIVDINHSFLGLLGYEASEAIGMDTMEFVVPECRDLVEQQITSRSEQPYEVTCLRKDGTMFPAEIQGKVVHLHGLQAQVTALRDITERKQAELKLRTYAIQLKKVNQELEQFNYIAAHDLKTPLRTISTRMDLLAKQLAPLDEGAQRQLSRISLATLRMDRLLSDLVNYSQSGYHVNSLVLTNSQVVVEQVLHQQLQQQIQQSGAIVDIESPLPVILANVTQLAQIFQHLIGNSIKFCCAKPHINISATCSLTECTFCIADNGIGIPPRAQERIFEVFQKLHTQEEYEGSGIGLAIVRRIVDWHGGRIWVESNEGQGSQFYFALQKSQDAKAINSSSDHNFAHQR